MADMSDPKHTPPLREVPLEQATLPKDWVEQVRKSDPLLDSFFPGWSTAAHPIAQEPDGAVEFLARLCGSPEGQQHMRSVSPALGLAVRQLTDFLREHFQPDDDTRTPHSLPWARLQNNMGAFPSEFLRLEVLDVAAVVTGVKPAAVVPKSALLLPTVRALLGLPQGERLTIRPLPEWAGADLVIGAPFRVDAVVAAAELRRGLPDEELPDQYFRAFGQALGYSEAAIEYFLKRIHAKRAGRLAELTQS